MTTMLTFQEFISESAIFPSTVKHKAESVGGIMTFNHSPKHNEEVHAHLKANGFTQNGASHLFGPETHTEYVNKTTGTKVNHVKSKSRAYLEILKK